MRMSDWSSDVCSSDLQIVMEGFLHLRMPTWARRLVTRGIAIVPVVVITGLYGSEGTAKLLVFSQVLLSMQLPFAVIPLRSEEHTSALQSLMRISYAVFCLKKKKNK